MLRSDEPLEKARNIAITILSDYRAPTAQDLATAVDAAIAASESMGDEIDRDLLLRRVEEEVSVFVAAGSVLEDADANHEPWLDARRAGIEWAFWEAYRGWLRKTIPPDVVRGLDNFTDDILSRLEDPARAGAWDRRGMVVGQVQSGKTSNYTGLICKAADAGYNFVVILAGVHNSLRSQTQQRIDEGFLGLDSRTSAAFDNTNRSIGVASGGRDHPPVFTLTSSDERGDFSRQVAGRIAGRLGSNPVILVVKKNKTVLENLIAWITSTNGETDPNGGRSVVRKFPLLLIDDEADYASVNTKKIEIELDEDGAVVAESDPTAINQLIRKLLSSFEKSAMVSYTATPFANIFIHEEETSEKYGEDLFPRSFILRIPPPSNYVGPAEVFGVPSRYDRADRPGLPVLRTVSDAEDWLPTGHRKTAVLGQLPDSLREALRAFILVCAARASRGDVNVHNSMLIHVTRFVDVQERVDEQVSSELDALKERLRYGDGGAARLLDELEQLWIDDFQPTCEHFPESHREVSVTWDEVATHLPAASARIQVVRINGSAGDSLTYSDHSDGASVIAIGGDKLSRGLTLEGLSVSYYLRASKMYDTLMQMGRWFGYRRGYNDLMRLYTTAELQMWYRDITVANEELHGKFDEMAASRSNPRDFALYVRQSPAGLLVTARGKMRSGINMQLSYSGDISETVSFRKDASEQDENLKAAERFLTEQAAHFASRRGAGNFVWNGVSGGDVAALLETVKTSETATKANSALLAKYIRSRLEADELTDWTVAVIDNTRSATRVPFAGREVGLTLRHENITDHPSVFSIKRFVNPVDEFLDLTKDEQSAALALTIDAWEDAGRKGAPRAKARPKIPSGEYVRKVRPATRGLLTFYLLEPPRGLDELERGLLGFFVSFPESPGAPTINIVMPKRYWESEIT